LTRMRLEAGDTIKLVIPLAESDHDLAEANHDREVETTAKIVRSDPLPPERADLWKREVAVRFEEPLGDYEQEFKKLAVLAKAAGFPY